MSLTTVVIGYLVAALLAYMIIVWIRDDLEDPGDYVVAMVIALIWPLVLALSILLSIGRSVTDLKGDKEQEDE